MRRASTGIEVNTTPLSDVHSIADATRRLFLRSCPEEITLALISEISKACHSSLCPSHSIARVEWELCMRGLCGHPPAPRLTEHTGELAAPNKGDFRSGGPISPACEGITRGEHVSKPIHDAVLWPGVAVLEFEWPGTGRSWERCLAISDGTLASSEGGYEKPEISFFCPWESGCKPRLAMSKSELGLVILPGEHCPFGGEIGDALCPCADTFFRKWESAPKGDPIVGSPLVHPPPYPSAADKELPQSSAAAGSENDETPYPPAADKELPQCSVAAGSENEETFLGKEERQCC